MTRQNNFVSLGLLGLLGSLMSTQGGIQAAPAPTLLALIGTVSVRGRLPTIQG